MGQSAAVYRVSSSYFTTLREAQGGICFDGKLAAECAIFQGTHCGLEYVLCRIFPDSAEQLKGIFGPKDRVGADIEEDDFDAFLAAWEEGRIISYLPPEKVSVIASLLRSIDEQVVVQNYYPDEMNEEGIYPDGLWAAGRDEERAFNELHLLQDIGQLKNIFAAAESGGDYLVVYVG